MFWIGLLTGMVATATISLITMMWIAAKAYRLGKEDQAQEDDEFEQLQKIVQIANKNRQQCS